MIASNVIPLIQKAMENNPKLLDRSVDGFVIQFVDIPSQGFTIVTVSYEAGIVYGVFYALIEHKRKSGDIPKVTMICKSCFGRGTINTGISESPYTICEKCDGTGEAK